MYIGIGFLAMCFFIWAFGNDLTKALHATGHPVKIALGVTYLALLLSYPLLILGVTLTLLIGWLFYVICSVAWRQSKLGATIFFLTIATLVVLANWH